VHRFRDMADYWSNYRPRQGCHFLTHLMEWTPTFRKDEFGLKKLETLLYRTMWSVFRYFKPLGVTHKCDRQLDRPSYFTIASVILCCADKNYANLFCIYLVTDICSAEWQMFFRALCTNLLALLLTYLLLKPRME